MQRVVIIPSDKMVSVDGEVRTPLEFEIDPGIHAVQWYGGYGEIEFNSVFDGEKIVKPANRLITSLDEFQPAIDAWSAYVPPEPVPPPQ